MRGGAHEPAVAELPLLHIRGQQPVDEDARLLAPVKEVETREMRRRREGDHREIPRR